MTETCRVSQYDFRTGTRFVISGSMKLMCATRRVIDARTAVAERANGERLLNINPARRVTHEMKIIDS